LKLYITPKLNKRTQQSSLSLPTKPENSKKSDVLHNFPPIIPNLGPPSNDKQPPCSVFSLLPLSTQTSSENEHNDSPPQLSDVSTETLLKQGDTFVAPFLKQDDIHRLFELSDEIAATCVLLSDEMSRNLSEICSKSIAKDVPLNSIYEACEQTSANCSLLSSQLSDQCVLVSGQSVAPNFTIYSTHQMQNTCNLLAEETNLLCNRISNEINTSMNPLHKEMLSLCTRTAENCHDAIFAMPHIYDDTGMALFCQEQKDLARVTNESSLCVSDQMLATILAI